MQQLLHRGAAVTQHRTDEVLDASWDDLKAFLLARRYRSFRNAAEVLGLTSTTLMRRIDRLEERIGFKLFLRDQSGLDAQRRRSRDACGRERRWSVCAFNIFRRASQSSNDPAGTVRVAVTEGPGNFWILPRLIDFQNTYRKIMVDLRCAMEQADVARLEVRYRHSARTADKSRPHRRQARQASHLPLCFRSVPNALRTSRIARRARKSPNCQAKCAAGRRYRLCPNSGLDVAGGHRRHQDKLQRRRSLRGRARRRHRFPADLVDRPGCAFGRRRSGRLQSSCRSLAYLPQGVSKLGSTQDRHRLAQEDLRSQVLSLFQG